MQVPTLNLKISNLFPFWNFFYTSLLDVNVGWHHSNTQKQEIGGRFLQICSMLKQLQEHPTIHLYNKYFVTAHYMPSNSSKNLVTSVKKTVPFLVKLKFCWGRRTEEIDKK